MIQINQLGKSYCHNKSVQAVLNNINFTISSGSIFGIIGRSGAGKSTLLRTINCLEVPTEGEVLVDKQNIHLLKGKDLREYRQQVGMVFQQFNLLNSRTVYENIALPLVLQKKSSLHINQKVTELLDIVGLSTRADYYPHHLSGGQKQRVAIARALTTEPKILLCDEATSALDAESTAHILSLLKKINKLLGITVVLVTHELEVVKQICHEVAVLHQGELLEVNSVFTLFTQPKHHLTKSLIFQEQLEDVQGMSVANAPFWKLIKLNFIGQDSELPFISDVVKQFDVAINIRQANVERINEKSIGYTVCEITAQTAVALSQALAFIEQSSIQTEVLSNV